jgi:hypothetical protein
MTPQASFMFLAPLLEGQEVSLHALLETMNGDDGLADPNNTLVPFGLFDRLHFARFTILTSSTREDIGVYGFPAADWPPSLAFLGDCDGPAGTFIAELVKKAGPGLQLIFAHCQGFDRNDDLLSWLRQHAISPTASYVNWLGRTVARIREDRALQQALSKRWQEIADEASAQAPDEIYARLMEFIDEEKRAGRLILTPDVPTSLTWRIRNLAHLIVVPAGLLVASPILLLVSPLLAFRLRSLEKSDPEITLRSDQNHVRRLAAIEDRDVTNQFSAFGELKPGLYRRYTVVLLLVLLNYASRHIYRRGYLTRVQTIHFARWVMLDNKRHVYFASNYDGSLESYMDDFINKVAWGINMVFGNGVGFPGTRWLIHGGAKHEQKYKNFLRRHQLPTQVWYKAYPGLSVADLNRNTRIREGIDRRATNKREIAEWLSLV